MTKRNTPSARLIACLKNSRSRFRAFFWPNDTIRYDTMMMI